MTTAKTPTSAINESHLQAAVSQLIEDINRFDGSEGRQHARCRYLRPVTITLDYGERHVSGLTREISRFGMSLLHGVALEPSKVTVTMRNESGYALTIPITIVWCRPCGGQWYLSGGRFLDVPTDGDSAAAGFDEPADARYQHPESMPSAEEILDIVQRNIVRLAERSVYDPNVNRRFEERYCVTLPLTVTPVDSDLQPVGDRRQAVTRDISSSGIALLSHQAPDSSLLALKIMDRDGETKLNAVMEVLRCSPIGDFYQVSGKFLSKVYRAQSPMQ